METTEFVENFAEKERRHMLSIFIGLLNMSTA